MYKYYEEIIEDKHYYYANEIAEKLTIHLGVVTKSGKIPVRMIQALLNDMDKALAESHGMAYRKLYYNTRHGLKRVYRTDIQAISMVFYGKEPNKIHVLYAGGKSYRYMIKDGVDL